MEGKEAEGKAADTWEGEFGVGTSEHAKAAAAGFKIVSMSLRDAEAGRVLWQNKEDWDQWMWSEVGEAHLPADILRCEAVAREVVFSSTELMQDFSITQRILLRGVPIETWFFHFGFVIPGSTNSWEQTIIAAPTGQMLPAHVLSGNAEIETTFRDGEEVIAKCLVRLYYHEA